MRKSLLSLLLLLDVVDCVVEAATRPLSDEDVEPLASRLDAAVFAYLEAFKIAYGRDSMRHKHHELVHLAAQLLKDKRLLWCFTAERKHIVTKSVMQHNKCRRGFSFGAVARMLTAQISCLDEAPWLSRLDNAAHECPELGHSCRLSRGMTWMGTHVRHGNPLFVGRGHVTLVLVVACVAVGDRFGIMVRPCVQVGAAVYSSEWSVQNVIVRRDLVPTDVLNAAQNWRYASFDRLVVLH